MNFPSFGIPTADQFENVNCLLCGASDSEFLIYAEDDLTGKPGRFRFVTCTHCGLTYQNPRLKQQHIAAYYDEEYIAHRKKNDWGVLTPLYRRAMEKHDRDKLDLIRRYLSLHSESQVLDVGCGAGTFLVHCRKETGASAVGVDFKDLSTLPWMKDIEFRYGRLHEQDLNGRCFDLITMWHFLEHDYEPMQTLAYAQAHLAQDGRMIIEVPRLDSLTFKLFRERWPGLQAPQHTALFTRSTLVALVQKAGLEVVDYLPYGAFPPYFYLFSGAAFKVLRGRGLNLQKAIYPYFLGQALLAPILLFQRRLNLAMQTIICRRPFA